MLIGIDLGTSTCKVIAVDREGRVVAVASRDYPMINLRPGWAEQEPDAWWRATGEAMVELTSQLPENGQEVVGIGMCGQMHGLTPLDADGNVIRPAIIWNDQRAAAECDWITEQAGGLDELLRMTRNRMLPGFTGGKIVWLREHEPDHYAAMARLLNPKDYIRLRMTGVYATDVSDASGTGLFDVEHRTWSTELLGKIGVEETLLPDVVESIEQTGSRRRRGVRGLGPPGRHAGLRRRRRRRDPDDGDGADRGGVGRLHHRDRRHRRGWVVALSRQPGRPRAGQRRQRARALAHHGRVAERGRRLPVAARRPHAAERLAEAHLRAAGVAGQGRRARCRRRHVRALPARRALALRRAGRQRDASSASRRCTTPGTSRAPCSRAC